MNKRIKQLAEQAGMYVEARGEPWPKWMSAEECELAYAKFAELIVRECAEVANDHNSEAEGITLGVGRVIKEHFGVEE